MDQHLEAMSAASRDRTNEFEAVLKSMKGRQVVEKIICNTVNEPIQIFD